MSSSYNKYDIHSSRNRTPWTMNIVHSVRMDEPKDRLKRARTSAGYDSPSEAARAFPRDVNKNTLISHENGNRAISRKAAQKYAELFGVTPGWILYGKEDDTNERIPVLSMVSASNLREQHGVTNDDVDRWITVSNLPRGDWVALIVEGDSMNRIAPDGALIVVNRSDDRLLDGRYYVFQQGGGAATFKRYKRNPEMMQPFSTNPDHLSIPVTEDLYVFGRVRRVITDI